MGKQRLDRCMGRRSGTHGHPGTRSTRVCSAVGIERESRANRLRLIQGRRSSALSAVISSLPWSDSQDRRANSLRRRKSNAPKTPQRVQHLYESNRRGHGGAGRLDATIGIAILMWRFRSSHPRSREFAMRTSEPEPHSNHGFPEPVPFRWNRNRRLSIHAID